MTAEGKKRRGHGEVNVTQLPSGRWRWRVWAKVGGKSTRLTGTADTEKQARAEGQRARVDAERGKVAVNRSVTLGAYLAEWLGGLDGISDNTRAVYGNLMRVHILPSLGGVKLAAVTPAVLRKFYGELRDRKAVRRENTLGYSVRVQVHSVMTSALGQAAADGLIPGNPAAVKGLRPVRGKDAKAKAKVFTPLEAARFLTVASSDGERSGQVLAFLLLTGMRRGEALGLRWEKVTLTGSVPAARVDVQRSTGPGGVFEGPPKTRNARRVVPLSPEAVALLERVRNRTDEEHAALYPERERSPYVFPNMTGEPYRPDSMYGEMRRVCQSAGVPLLSPHDLRHTFASLAALRGVRVEVLSRILGHADPAFTLRQYRHLYPEELGPVSLELPEVPAEVKGGTALPELLPDSPPASPPARRKVLN